MLEKVGPSRFALTPVGAGLRSGGAGSLRTSVLMLLNLPLWSSYEGFLFYHLTMGIALSMIPGGDVALLYDSLLATGGKQSQSTAVPSAMRSSRRRWGRR